MIRFLIFDDLAYVIRFRFSVFPILSQNSRSNAYPLLPVALESNNDELFDSRICESDLNQTLQFVFVCEIRALSNFFPRPHRSARL